MNSKIVISISITITVIIIAFSLSQIGITGEKSNSSIDESSQVSGMLKKVEQDRILNEQSDDPYYPKEREWIQSGPFLMDRSEYVLGEKVFMNIENMDENTKGKMIFSKIINSTHNQVYKEVYFDGSRPQQNFYVAIYPSVPQNFCTVDELIGDWEIILAGTELENFKFKILDKMLPGADRLFQTVC